MFYQKKYYIQVSDTHTGIFSYPCVSLSLLLKLIVTLEVISSNIQFDYED